MNLLLHTRRYNRYINKTRCNLLATQFDQRKYSGQEKVRGRGGGGGAKNSKTSRRHNIEKRIKGIFNRPIYYINSIIYIIIYSI